MKVNQWDGSVGGDKNAFLALYKSHYQALFSYGISLTANKELTKDCLQELFLEIWHKQSSLTKEIKNVRSYLFTWLRRKIFRELALLSGEKCTEEMVESFAAKEMCYEELLVAFQQSEEKKQRLRFALKKLTKQQLEMIRLKFFEKLSYSEIAARTSLTPRTIYNLIYQAIRHLREDMKAPLYSYISKSGSL
jgi:RNA polymerase sigma factor (sigma-70 family)